MKWLVAIVVVVCLLAAGVQIGAITAGKRSSLAVFFLFFAIGIVGLLLLVSGR